MVSVGTYYSCVQDEEVDYEGCKDNFDPFTVLL